MLNIIKKASIGLVLVSGLSLVGNFDNNVEASVIKLSNDSGVVVSDVESKEVIQVKSEVKSKKQNKYDEVNRKNYNKLKNIVTSRGFKIETNPVEEGILIKNKKNELVILVSHKRVFINSFKNEVLGLSANVAKIMSGNTKTASSIYSTTKAVLKSGGNKKIGNLNVTYLHPNTIELAWK